MTRIVEPEEDTDQDIEATTSAPSATPGGPGEQEEEEEEDFDDEEDDEDERCRPQKILSRWANIVIWLAVTLAAVIPVTIILTILLCRALVAVVLD